MVNFKFFSISVIILVILLFTNLTSSFFRKRIPRKRHLFLPSVIEFEVKGNSLGWIPIEMEESSINATNNLAEIIPDNLRLHRFKRRYRFDNVNFISGALSCSNNNNATIEPNIIYDDQDYNDDEEEEKGKSTTETAVEKETGNVTYSTTISIDSGQSTKSNETITDNITLSTIAINQTVKTTMPTKLYAGDECNKVTGKSTSLYAITTLADEQTVAPADECTEFVEVISKCFSCIPQIITPPFPLPPLNLSFPRCNEDLKEVKQDTTQSMLTTKAIETRGNESCSSGFLFGENESSEVLEEMTTKKGNKKCTTTKLPSCSRSEDDLNKEHEKSSTVSKLYNIIKPFKDLMHRTKKPLNTSTIHNNDQSFTTTPTVNQGSTKVTTVKEEHTTKRDKVSLESTSTVHQKTTSESRSSTHHATISSSIHQELTPISTSSTHQSPTSSVHQELTTKSTSSILPRVTTKPTSTVHQAVTKKRSADRIMPTKNTEDINSPTSTHDRSGNHRILFQKHYIDEKEDKFNFPLSYLSKQQGVGVEANGVVNEEITDQESFINLWKKNQMCNDKTFGEKRSKPLSQVVIRIPSSLADLPVIILRDPQIPALSMSVLPGENNHLKNPFFTILNSSPRMTLPVNNVENNYLATSRRPLYNLSLFPQIQRDSNYIDFYPSNQIPPKNINTHLPGNNLYSNLGLSTLLGNSIESRYNAFTHSNQQRRKDHPQGKNDKRSTSKKRKNRYKKHNNKYVKF